MSPDDIVPAYGAYGMRLVGIAPSVELLARVDPDAPQLTVRRTAPNGELPADSPPLTVGLIDGGRLGVDVERGLAVYALEQDVCDDDMVHPWLVPAVCEIAVARQCTVLHGGILEFGGAAIGIIGDRESGKSSILAQVATRHPLLTVMADDLIVIRAQKVYAGPRCIDLRPSSITAFPQISTTPSRSATRLRLVVPSCKAAARLIGFVELEWGPSLAIQPVRVADRLATLLPHMSTDLSRSNVESVLDLASLPVWRLQRPRDWAVLGHSVDLLQNVILDA